MGGKWFESSTGSGDLSLTIKGLSISGIIPIFAAVLTAFGVKIDESEVAQFIAGVIGLVGVITTLFGLARKVYFRTIGR